MNRSSNILVLILILILAGVIYGQNKLYIENNKRTEVAGVIRCEDEKGWHVIHDKNHEPVNIEKVEVSKGVILVYFSFTAAKIHSFIVTPDETFALSGYIVGARVNKNVAAISISKIQNGKVIPVNASKIRSRYGNLWIYGVFSR